MKIAIVGQQDFGKAVLEACLKRGDQVAAVFCAPEREGARPDALRVAAQEKGLKVHQFKSLKAPEAAEAMKAANADIEFRNIDFAYEQKTVLQNINLKVKAGQLVALVGKSGSGKTSLTNLLLRFYDPQTLGAFGDTESAACQLKSPNYKPVRCLKKPSRG